MVEGHLSSMFSSLYPNPFSLFELQAHIMDNEGLLLLWYIKIFIYGTPGEIGMHGNHAASN